MNGARSAMCVFVGLCASVRVCVCVLCAFVCLWVRALGVSAWKRNCVFDGKVERVI